jgi:hypothetical protein
MFISNCVCVCRRWVAKGNGGKTRFDSSMQPHTHTHNIYETTSRWYAAAQAQAPWLNWQAPWPELRAAATIDVIFQRRPAPPPPPALLHYSTHTSRSNRFRLSPGRSRPEPTVALIVYYRWIVTLFLLSINTYFVSFSLIFWTFHRDLKNFRREWLFLVSYEKIFVLLFNYYFCIIIIIKYGGGEET